MHGIAGLCGGLSRLPFDVSTGKGRTLFLLPPMRCAVGVHLWDGIILMAAA
jgi:hypothetical protein